MTDQAAATVRGFLRSRFDATLEERVARALEVRHQPIVPFHHFTPASTEVVYLYRDGYFLSTAMATQSLNEGIIRFIAQRNGLNQNSNPCDLVGALLGGGLISDSCAGAMRRILHSFRNDFHHLNPSLLQVPIAAIAKRNLEDIAAIEGEIFAHTYDEGRIVPSHPKYWDTKPDGTVEVMLRSG
jgi:hypothetical protein